MRLDGRPKVGRGTKGQSTVELALLMPLLALLLAVVVDGGLALNSWVRVNTAARDATRFALDNGRDSDVASLVLRKMTGLNANNVNVYVISGTTDNSGRIPSNTTPWWKARHPQGPGAADGYKIQPSRIEARLRAIGNPNNVPFVIVEVDYIYSSFLGSFLNWSGIPMTSYAIIQKY